VGYNAAAMGHFDKDVSIKIAGYTDPKVIKITGEVVADAAVNNSAATPVKAEASETPAKQTVKAKPAAKKKAAPTKH
nr:hypothetical protein [Flavisolibacter sp.]